MSSLEKHLEPLELEGVEANFKAVMPLAGADPRACGRALKALSGGIEKDPASPRLWALKGKLLSLLGRYERARSDLRRSISLDPSRALPHAWLAEAYLLENRVASASRALERALKRNPFCAWARFYRAAAAFIMGRRARSRQELEGIVGLAQAGDAAVAAKAFLCLLEAQEGRFDSAGTLIEEVMKARPQRKWPYALRAVIHRLRGDRSSALKDIDAALKEVGQEWAYLERAALLKEKGRWREALEDMRLVFKLRSSPGQELYLRRGELWLAGKRCGLALKDLRRALALGRAAQARGFGLDLVQALKEKGQGQTAIKVLKEISRRLPGDAELRRVLREMRGETRASRSKRREAVEKSAEVSALTERFRLAILSRDYEEAARMGEAVLDRTRRLQHLQALSVPFLPRHDGSSLSGRKRNDLRRGLRDAQRHILRHPKSPWGYYLLNQWRCALRQPEDHEGVEKFTRFDAARYGWMRAAAAHSLLYRGRFRAAVRQFEIARDFSQPPDWRWQCYIAEALACQGDLPAAMAAFRRAQKWAGFERGQAMAWKAEVLLWAGRYKDALKTLNAIPKGSQAPYALCWKGAALSRLGSLRRALGVLNAVVARFPRDDEARVWRAETLLRMGRAGQAEKEAGVVLCRAGMNNYFACAIRGLARAAQGDEKGLREDAEAVPDNVAFLACRRLGVARKKRRDHPAEILRAIIEMGRGNRRSDVPLPLGASG